jgi:hypothetical protein
MCHLWADVLTPELGRDERVQTTLCMQALEGCGTEGLS